MKYQLDLHGEMLMEQYHERIAEESRDGSLIHSKLQKKLVKNNGFWKINAIWPKNKGKTGKNEEVRK